MTLTQAASLTKKFLIALVLIIFLGTMGKIGYSIWYQHYLSTQPKVEEKPDNKFGALPPLAFPQNQVLSSNFTYSLDNETGNLPQTPAILKVYFIPQGSVTLLAPDKSAELAQKLGFNTQPQIVSESSYKFTDSVGGSLDIDLTNGNFILNRSATGSAGLKNSQAVSQDQLVSDFRNYLSNKDFLPDALKESRSKTDGNKVSLWPSDFDTLPIVTPLVTQGLVVGQYSPNDETDKRYSQISYTYWQIDPTTYSTYKIKPVSQAFDELKSGSGYINLNPAGKAVSISKVYLAYYESETYSQYLQPVFVFEGPGFEAYISAISTN